MSYLDCAMSYLTQKTLCAKTLFLGIGVYIKVLSQIQYFFTLSNLGVKKCYCRRYNTVVLIHNIESQSVKSEICSSAEVKSLGMITYGVLKYCNTVVKSRNVQVTKRQRGKNTTYIT